MVQSLQVEDPSSENGHPAAAEEQLEPRIWPVLVALLGVMCVFMVLMGPVSPAAITAGVRVACKSLRPAAVTGPMVRFQPGLSLPFAPKPTEPTQPRSRAPHVPQPAAPSRPDPRAFPQVTPFAKDLESTQKAAADSRVNPMSPNTPAYQEGRGHEGASQDSRANQPNPSSDRFAVELAAFHEVGVAATGVPVPEYDQVARVTVLGRGGLGGLTFFVSGGVERLASTAYDMGQDMSQGVDMRPRQGMIGGEVKHLLQGSYRLAKQLLSLNHGAIDAFANALRYRVTVGADELAQIMRQNGVAVSEKDFNVLGKIDLLFSAPDLRKSTTAKVAAVGAALLLSSSPAFAGHADALPSQQFSTGVLKDTSVVAQVGWLPAWPDKVFGCFTDTAVGRVNTFVVGPDAATAAAYNALKPVRPVDVAKAPTGPFKLPQLPYDYKALAPAIDEATMRFNHDKHFYAHTVNLNRAFEGKAAGSIVDLQKGAIAAGPAIRNHGGGYYNHGLFFESMTSPDESGEPSPALAKAITDNFGSMDEMKAQFSNAARNRFGAGWAWLGVTPDGRLAITSTPNQDNPLMDGVEGTRMIPILGLDVWEHAYYLQYQNLRSEYIKAWWNVVDWDEVSVHYEKYASKGRPVVWRGA